MHTAFDRTFRSWAGHLLASLDSAFDPALPVRPLNLADMLAEAAWWEGCPRAADFDEPARRGEYRRFALTEPGRGGYSALLVLWPAAHATPVHDHDGLWGIECMLDGALEVVSYTLNEADPVHPARHGQRLLGIGDREVFDGIGHAHQCRNTSPNRAALSLHVYGGDLQRFRIWHRGEADDWITAIRRVPSEPIPG